MYPPKDVNFDPKKELCPLIKGGKAIKKYLKDRLR